MWAVLTGDAKPGSIGEAIRLAIEDGAGFTHSYEKDVREPIGVLSGPYSALVMCHGVTHLDWFENAPIEKMREIVDVNLTGTINVAQAFVKGSIDKPWRKRIIIIGSMAHKAVLNGSAVYCATKAALAHLSRCLAWELAPKAFDVYCVHPSNTEGAPMSEETIRGLMSYRGLTRKDATAYWNDSSIREKSLQTKDIANLVMHLLSPKESGYLSGTQFDLAGGQR